MLKLLLNNIKTNKIVFMFIVISFTILMLIISLGVSFFDINKDIVIDYNHGNLDNQRIIQVSSKNENDELNIDKILSICNKFSKNNSIYISGFSYIQYSTYDNDKWILPIELISIGNDYAWNPKCIKGQNLSKEQSCGTEKVAVIGSSIANNKISCKNEINILGENFTIIGQVGIENMKSDYLNTVFIPMNTLPAELKKNVKLIQIRIYNNKNEIINQSNELISALMSSDIYCKNVKIDNSIILYKNLLKIFLITTLCLLIGIFDISFSISFILKKENKFYKEYKKLISVILLILLFLSSFIALIINYSILPIIKNNFNYILNINSFSISYSNIVVLFISSIILSLIFSKININKIRKEILLSKTNEY